MTSCKFLVHVRACIKPTRDYFRNGYLLVPIPAGATIPTTRIQLEILPLLKRLEASLCLGDRPVREHPQRGVALMPRAFLR